jgi:yeast amino acid transporter
MGGVYASWAGFVLIVLVLIAQFYVVSAPSSLCCSSHSLTLGFSAQALWPIGGMDSEGSAVAYDFFLIWLAAPICLAMWIYAVVRFRRFKWLRLDEIDLDVGLAAISALLHIHRVSTDVLLLSRRPAASRGSPSRRCAS